MNDFIEKINIAINFSKQNIQKINDNIEYTSKKTIELLNNKNVNKEEYRIELQKYNYILLKYNHLIEQYNLYIERCNIYLEYIKSLNLKDEILIKHSEYKLIKNIQEEYIYKIKSDLSELKEKNLFMRENIDSELKKMIENKNKYYERFIDGDYFIDQNKVFSNEYLNFEIYSLVTKIYPNKYKRKIN